MADALKVLGQVAIAVADTEEQLYKVPAATSATVSSIVVCNLTGTDATFRIGIDVGDDNAGASEAKDYVYHDRTVRGGDTFVATVGLTLGAADSINVRASATTVTISAYGVEVT